MNSRFIQAILSKIEKTSSRDSIIQVIFILLKIAVLITMFILAAIIPESNPEKTNILYQFLLYGLVVWIVGDVLRTILLGNNVNTIKFLTNFTHSPDYAFLNTIKLVEDNFSLLKDFLNFTQGLEGELHTVLKEKFNKIPAADQEKTKGYCLAFYPRVSERILGWSNKIAG